MPTRRSVVSKEPASHAAISIAGPVVLDTAERGDYRPRTRVSATGEHGDVAGRSPQHDIKLVVHPAAVEKLGRTVGQNEIDVMLARESRGLGPALGRGVHRDARRDAPLAARRLRCSASAEVAPPMSSPLRSRQARISSRPARPASGFADGDELVQPAFVGREHA